MNESILVEAGLTEAQANAYIRLVENSPIAPPHLAIAINESRTNTYKVLEQLELMGLAQKDESDKKLKYWAKSPYALKRLVEQERESITLKEKKLEASLETLVDSYLEHNDKPSIRMFQGKEVLRDIYKDQISDCKEVLLIRSTSDVKFYSYEEMRKLRGEFAKAKVKRHAFSPDAKDIPINWKETDPLRFLERTWMRADDYTAPVEWGVYGNKVSIISFGEEAVGMVIESKQIAEAMRQILNLLDEGLKARSDYSNLPSKAGVKITGSIEVGKGTHVFIDET